MIFPVGEKKIEDLSRRMKALDISENDFEESFVRSQGSGGQNVNKTSTCVVLIHKPSGVMVKCQKERTQALNRFLARRLLVEKLESKVKGFKDKIKSQHEKIRRQKRKRDRRAKEKMLEAKHHRSAIKDLRKEPLDE
jgi:peptide chain release factor